MQQSRPPLESAPSASLQGVAVHVQQLSRSFGNFQALRSVSFDLAPGRVLALLGPSGCGKSTLLKLLAGLDRPTSGQIQFNHRLIASATHCTPPQHRQLGMVFQDYALWPHMSVGANVGFGLRMQGVAAAEVDARVNQVLQRVGLAAMAQRAPSALSGGQQQRVALARAIVAAPALLLFDEPLSNLDRDLRESLCADIGDLLREIGTTAVYVTHDHEEACSIADDVAVMFQGSIAQLSPPQQLWGAPANADVARFLKLGALLPAWSDGRAIGIEQMTAPTETGASTPFASAHINIPMEHVKSRTTSAGANLAKGHAPEQRQTGHLLIPESAITVYAGQASEQAIAIQARIKGQQYSSGRYRTTLELSNGQALQLWLHDRVATSEAAIQAWLEPNQLHWFAPSPSPALQQAS